MDSTLDDVEGGAQETYHAVNGCLTRFEDCAPNDSRGTSLPT
jgi:hypothetical protein